MLRQRLLTSIIGIPILVLAVVFGNPWFAIAISIIAVLSGYEFYRITRELSFKPIIYFGLFIILLLVLSPFYHAPVTQPFIIGITIIISLIWLILRRNHATSFSDWAWTIAGIMYIGWMLSYWTALSTLNNSVSWIIWAIAMVMVCDAAAFFTGRALGKHPLAPLISPKKTWEGAGGGILGSILASIAFGIICSLPVPFWHLIVAAIVVSIVSQFGDLAESLLKRTAHVKDSGKLLPGHGGMLDRIDSYILIGAIAYYYVIFIAPL
jgi:phosphatidate cytidylyltransferase